MLTQLLLPMQLPSMASPMAVLLLMVSVRLPLLRLLPTELPAELRRRTVTEPRQQLLLRAMEMAGLLLVTVVAAVEEAAVVVAS